MRWINGLNSNMINNDISLESIFNKLKQLQIKNEVICIILS